MSDRYPKMGALDAAIARGPIEDSVPETVKEAAQAWYERESEAYTGHKWDWAQASNEVKYRYYLKVLLDA